MIRFLQLPKRFYASPSRAWAARKAMIAYVKANPVCAACKKRGTRLNPIVAHHIIPYHVAPELGADPSNFIALHHPSCHHVAGHACTWDAHVINVVAVCKSMVIVKKTAAPKPGTFSAKLAHLLRVYPPNH